MLLFFRLLWNNGLCVCVCDCKIIVLTVPNPDMILVHVVKSDRGHPGCGSPDKQPDRAKCCAKVNPGHGCQSSRRRRVDSATGATHWEAEGRRTKSNKF